MNGPHSGTAAKLKSKPLCLITSKHQEYKDALYKYKESIKIYSNSILYTKKSEYKKI